MSRLSVIIPTLNEAVMLPRLLDALQAQTRPPDEIIVADAGSQDGTRELAQARGARVVQGGLPGAGRNAGARVATGDLLLFLDADVLPLPNFIADALKEFTEAGYDVATCLIEPLDDDPADRILTEATNLFLQVVQYLVPHAPGFCILIYHRLHEAIGGFDESAKMAEDHDYVQRAARYGTFGVLTSVRIRVSTRRIEEEGLTKLALKYLWAEMHALAGKPVYSMPFEYKFGAYAPPGRAPPARWKIMDVDWLRQQLGKVENPLQQLSAAGISRLERLVTWNTAESVSERIQLSLDTSDLDRLHRYLLRRLDLLRQTRGSLRKTLKTLQTRSVKESIELLDANWLRLWTLKETDSSEEEENP